MTFDVIKISLFTKNLVSLSLKKEEAAVTVSPKAVETVTAAQAAVRHTAARAAARHTAAQAAVRHTVDLREDQAMVDRAAAHRVTVMTRTAQSSLSS